MCWVSWLLLEEDRDITKLLRVGVHTHYPSSGGGGESITRVETVEVKCGGLNFFF